MIRDLAELGADEQRSADVVIVGGGIAGLVTAQRLRRSGLRVLVLESGGESQTGEEHELNEVDLLGDGYTGAKAGRYRCLGGTSSRWGGAMLPFLPVDMEESSAGWSGAWPVTWPEIEPYGREVEALFGLPPDPYDRPDLFETGESPADFLPRLAKWPAFAKRNVATLFRRPLETDPELEVWLHATVTQSAVGPGGELDRVEASGPSGRKITAHGARFVFAAGAIETTRLLLLLDRSHGDRIFAPDDVLGRHFHDHLSAHSAAMLPLREAELGQMAGFRFEAGGMRNLRFEPSPEARRRERLPGGFVHLVFGSQEPNGFDGLREIYRAAQRRHLPAASDLLLVGKSAPWFLRAAYARFAQGRLLVPPGSDFVLNVLVEQHPHRDNRIALSASRVDRYGLPLATIDWRVRDEDAENHRRLYKLFRRFWTAAGLDAVAKIVERAPEQVQRELVEGGGTKHPGGSTRMGASAREGVLSGSLAVHRVPNLTCISTAAFPTGGGANPTFTMMMFALCAADSLAEQIRRGPH